MTHNFKGFIDTTFRDGQASPLLFDTNKYAFTLKEKIQLIDTMLELGVRHFEFFSPIVSNLEKNHFLAIRKHVKAKNIPGVFLLAHCRCHPDDITQALEAGFDGLNLYMGLSEHAQQTYNKSFDQLMAIVKTTIIDIRREHPKLWLRFSGEDAFRTKLSSLFNVYDQIADLVDTIGTPDTTGTATPKTVAQRVRDLKTRYPKVNLECHFHNDLGLATANTLAAVENGAEFVDSTVWGLAERSGITSVTAALINFSYLDPKILDNYKTELCYPLNVLMASILKIQVPWYEPVSLTNRTHIAGVHQKAVLAKQGYEAHHLDKFGVITDQLLLGPLSGWNFIHYYLKEILNYIVTDEQAKEITVEFKNRQNKTKKSIEPEKLLNQIAIEYNLVKISIPEKFAKTRIEKLD